MEKLLQDALIKVSTVATDIFGVPGRAMIEALIAGEQDPRVLAELVRAACAASAPRWPLRSMDTSTTTMPNSPR